MTSDVVGPTAIEAAARDLGVDGRPVEVHASLRSFGTLADGAATLVDGMLAAGATVLAATMAPRLFGLPAPPEDRPARNGLDYDLQDAQVAADPWPGLTDRYDASRTEVASWLGALSAYVASHPHRERCALSTGEFAAIGPRAARLIEAETPDNVYGPLRALADDDGAVVLMGVGLTRMTLLHLAEIEAGRRPFIRWARDPNGDTTRVHVGECSAGFEQLADALRPIERTLTVGQSVWRAYPAQPTLQLAAEAIRVNPSITHCPDPHCIECADATAGGPLE